MAKYIVKRVLAAIATLFVLVTVVFFLVRLMPGEPFTNPKLTPEVAANMTYLELSTYPGYMDSFVAACFLPHTDKRLFPHSIQEM